MAKTLYLTNKRAEQLNIDLSKYPSAGPYPSVAGMKKQYWGKNALCVRQGSYVYKVSQEIYNRI